VTSWWSDHPDLEGVARHGRGELRQEAEEVESDAEHLRRRGRSLVDVCFEWMCRGDLVTIGVGDVEYQGRLEAAINDLVVVTTPGLRVAVAAAAIRFVRSDRPGAGEGTTGDRSITSFQALLGSYEVERRPVRVHDAAGSFDVSGIVLATTPDHVNLQSPGGQEWILARGAIACVLEQRDA
jgi:hypothetical protein